MKLITVSNIQKVFLSNLNVKGEVQLFIKALDKNEIPYEIHNDGKIEVLLFDNPLIPNHNECIENVFKKHVWGLSKIVWKTSPLNCRISNLKEIFITDFENSLTIPVAQFEKELKRLDLRYKYTGHCLGLYFKKPNFFPKRAEKYNSNFESILKYVKTVDRINWQ